MGEKMYLESYFTLYTSANHKRIAYLNWECRIIKPLEEKVIKTSVHQNTASENLKASPRVGEDIYNLYIQQRHILWTY